MALAVDRGTVGSASNSSSMDPTGAPKQHRPSTAVRGEETGGASTFANVETPSSSSGEAQDDPQIAPRNHPSKTLRRRSESSEDSEPVTGSKKAAVVRERSGQDAVARRKGGLERTRPRKKASKREVHTAKKPMKRLESAVIDLTVDATPRYIDPQKVVAKRSLHSEAPSGFQVSHTRIVAS